MNEQCQFLQAVVLDWAGTTVDHGSRAPAAVFQELFRRRGIDISVAQAREPMGMAKREHIAAIGAMPSVSEQWQTRFSAPLSEEDIDSMYREFLPMQKETLAEHCLMILGVPEAVESCRKMGLKIGSSTGYTHELMEVVSRLASDQGYTPDCVLCSEDAPTGRPAPYLLFEAAKRLGVYPMWSVVKVDDTTVGIEAGRNAGCWTVGVTRTGNEVGLSQSEFEALPESEQEELCQRASSKLIKAGAHYTIESVASLPRLIAMIDQRAVQGDLPMENRHRV